MGITGGPSQVPVLAFPHSEEAKSEFTTSRRFDLSYKGVLGLMALGTALFVSFALFRTAYWYAGVAIVSLTALFFLWPLLRGSSSPR